jgi:hypothetical protein
MPTFLNVGGNNHSIGLPDWTAGWNGHLLDIDPSGNPDIVGDARALERLPPATYDAIYCSHNLEHYYLHEVPKVLAGFRHVLKPQAFVHLRVPDINAVMRTAVENNMDISSVLYTSSAGSVTVHDVVYGFAEFVERSGTDFYAHKTGFSKLSLLAALEQAGFTNTYTREENLEIGAFTFTQPPSAEAIQLLNLAA